MGTRAPADTALPELVRLAVPLLQEAERQCPRPGAGRPPYRSTWFAKNFVPFSRLPGVMR
jgi:hypothetical protein